MGKLEFFGSVPGLPSARINQIGPIGISRKLSMRGIDRHGRPEMPGAPDYQPLELAVVGPDCPRLSQRGARPRGPGGRPDDSAEITLELRGTSLKNVLGHIHHRRDPGCPASSRRRRVAGRAPAVGACFEVSSLRLKLN